MLHLDIPVAGLGAAWADADGHQSVAVLFHIVEAATDNPCELHGVGYQMVGRCNGYGRLGAFAEDVVGGVGDTGGCVAAHRFAKHLVILEFGQVFEHQLLVGGVGNHDEMLGRYQRQEAFEGGAYEALASSEDIKELLGHIVFAERPEAASNAAGHNYTVSFHIAKI